MTGDNLQMKQFGRQISLGTHCPLCGEKSKGIVITHDEKGVVVEHSFRGDRPYPDVMHVRSHGDPDTKHPELWSYQ